MASHARSRLRVYARFVLLGGLALDQRVSAAQVPRPDSASLVASSQAMMDAITYGDTAAWMRNTVSTWFIADEEGRIIRRKEFLETLRPLPAGQSGSLTVRNPVVAGTADVAVISYDIDEVHHYYGQLLLTRFHATDTYRKIGQHWRQQASHMTAASRAYPGQPVPKVLADEYAGTYSLTPDIQMTVSADDSGLVMSRSGGTTQRLHALDDRIFIRHGVRGFWVFERDSSGTISRLVNWRDNNPVSWTRILGTSPVVATAQPTAEPLVLLPYAGTDLRTIVIELQGRRRQYIFDTGGGFSLVNTGDTTPTGCTPFGRLTGFRATGDRVTAQRCGRLDLRIGNFRVSGEVAAFDLTSLLGPKAPPVDGLLALNAFADTVLTIDLAHDRLYLESRQSLTARTANMRTASARIVTGPSGDVDVLLEVRAKTGTLWMVLDSGNNGPVFLSPHAFGQLGVSGTEAKAMSLDLDVIGLGPVPLRVASRDMIYDGLLNPAFLRRVILTVDFPRRQVWIAPAAP